ncbi:dihydrofolate reductase family protein [Arthrobacter sp. M4]|uniref:dihydrofolate reductase family protein n=1 Tax=Arthrobacter sp. M4 TaxID=218160 RepID=UPI001CDC036D|nr:dihydrofolate reductase family protein [Arthrobacter sp. M4]MCA4135017.1 dihydrofolate reductase family protein [Arthrobacter sp. M4]
MGRLVVQEFVTADGFAADVDGEFRFYEELEGGTAEFDRSQLAWLDSVEAMVLGARTYRMFVEYWPTPASDGEIIAPALNGLKRHIFTRTLTAAPWGDIGTSTVESGDAVEAIQRIKAQTQGSVVLWGSLSLAGTFFAANEVDEVRLIVLPVALGAGVGVFPSDPGAELLHLESAQTYDAGLVELVYSVVH